ncbi:MAG: DnaD domain protein [Lachnospiraceae bacterium]|jgi:DnaD/phage-associated family protein|nr:DnaD domain protein [Lachnospiraceae bacterium]
MKLEHKDISVVFSHTDIPDLFFTEYLASASGDFIKLYLYIAFLAKYNREIKIKDLSKSLNIPFKTIEEGLAYWENAGLITKKLNGYILNNLQEIELNKLYSPKLTLSSAELEKNEKNKYRAKAIENINNTFFQGIMSPSWYGDIAMWFKKYDFDEQVMNALFNYCFNKSALHRNYVQAVADAWAKNNIKTYADLEIYEEKNNHLNKIKSTIVKKLKLSRMLTQYEDSYIEKWTLEFKFNLDIIELALKKTTSKANPSFDYIDKLLSDWHDRNLKTVPEIESFLESFKNQNKNIKTLEKKSYSPNFEQRKYENFDKFYAN